MNDELRLEKYKMSLKSAWGYNDYNDWPIKVNSIMHLFLKEFATECLEDMQEIVGNEEMEARLLTSFVNPARLFRLIDPIIFGMKRLNITLGEQRKVVYQLLDWVKEMKVGSEFNEDGRNIILDEKTIADIIGAEKFKTARLEDAQLIQKFCGIMWAYTESIFFRAHEVTKEVHGAYPLSDGNQLIIREYLNLQPEFLWKEVPFLPYKKIQVYSIYNKELQLKLDSYNHLFLQGGNYVTNMLQYMIVADGNVIDVEELNQLIADAFLVINQIHQWTEEQDWRTLANKYADIYWYRKRPFREVLNKEPGVPDYIREKIANGEPDSRRVKNLTDKEIERLIRIVI